MLPLSINPPSSPEGHPLPVITAVPRTVELSDGVVNSVHADSVRICPSKKKVIYDSCVTRVTTGSLRGPADAVQAGDLGRLPAQ
jgi:hypothetical protein